MPAQTRKTRRIWLDGWTYSWQLAQPVSVIYVACTTRLTYVTNYNYRDIARRTLTYCDICIIYRIELTYPKLIDVRSWTPKRCCMREKNTRRKEIETSFLRQMVWGLSSAVNSIILRNIFAKFSYSSELNCIKSLGGSPSEPYLIQYVLWCQMEMVEW